MTLAKSHLRLVAATLLAGILGLALGVHFADAAENARFSPADKKAIGEIVRSYLLEHPELLNEVFVALQEKTDAQTRAKAADAIKKQPKDIFSDGYSFVAGNPNASVTVVEFFDYNCGHCRTAFPRLMKLIDDKADIRIIFKEYPIFEGSDEPAKAAMAAIKQGKYLEFHRALMATQGRVGPQAIDDAAKKAGLDLAKLKRDMKDPMIAARLVANNKLGEALAIDGTPSFVIGDELLSGWSDKLFDEYVQKARSKKKS